MKAGVLAQVEPESGELETAKGSLNMTSEENLNWAIHVLDKVSLENSADASVGRAAIEQEVDVENASIEGEAIPISEDTVVETRYTDFLFVPNSFTIVRSRDGIFAFDLIERCVGVPVSPVSIDLDSFLEENPDSDPWKIGFYENSGFADNGVVHGEQLLKDDQVGGILDINVKNQIGIVHQWDNDLVKVFVSRSGYVEVYQPSGMDSSEFSDYMTSNLLHHTTLK